MLFKNNAPLKYFFIFIFDNLYVLEFRMTSIINTIVPASILLMDQMKAPSSCVIVLLCWKPIGGL